MNSFNETQNVVIINIRNILQWVLPSRSSCPTNVAAKMKGEVWVILSSSVFGRC